MNVTIRVRALEGEWGVSYRGPVLRKVEIADTCPVCDGPRGPLRGLNQCDDGEFYWVNVWDNPCGHIDRYADIWRASQAVAA